MKPSTSPLSEWIDPHPKLDGMALTTIFSTSSTGCIRTAGARHSRISTPSLTGGVLGGRIR